MSIIKNPELYPLGLQKIEWVKRFMPVLNELERRYSDKKPLKGLRVSLCIHLEAKTAYLALLLRELGADVRYGRIRFPRRTRFALRLIT